MCRLRVSSDWFSWLGDVAMAAQLGLEGRRETVHQGPVKSVLEERPKRFLGVKSITVYLGVSVHELRLFRPEFACFGAPNIACF